MEDNVLRFQIIVDDLLFLVGQILQAGQDLRDDQFGFFLLELLVLLEVVIQVGTRTQFQDGAETVMVDLDSIVVFHYASVGQLLVDFILTQRMLYVIVFDLITPGVVKMMDFAGHFNAVFKVKRLIHF